jgi:Tfp pilus assembly protein PilV
MVEVLVSLVALSIGLLGVGKLVLFSVHANEQRVHAQPGDPPRIRDPRQHARQPADGEDQGYNVALGTVPAPPSIMCLGTLILLYNFN